MGLFEEAGRRFERFKQDVTAAADETADVECGDCGEPLFADQDACPECGSHAVVRPSPPEPQPETEPDQSDDAAPVADEASSGGDDRSPSE